MIWSSHARGVWMMAGVLVGVTGMGDMGRWGAPGGASVFCVSCIRLVLPVFSPLFVRVACLAIVLHACGCAGFALFSTTLFTSAYLIIIFLFFTLLYTQFYIHTVRYSIFSIYSHYLRLILLFCFSCLFIYF